MARSNTVESADFLALVQLIIDGEREEVTRRLGSQPALATFALPAGATRTQAAEFFFSDIAHYIYGGDTALHMAAAAHSLTFVKLLIRSGADCRAKNRRGAEPLHYAADGQGTGRKSQAKVIEYLVSKGADPNAVDKSGVAPLHRSVRNRSSVAVRALLDVGAAVTLKNKSGSTPLHLAVQTTGASGSGSEEAKKQQKEIIQLLLEHGAHWTDTDSNGKTVAEAASAKWVREWLAEFRNA